MKVQITNIITDGTSAIAEGLAFDAAITKEEFDAAIDLAVSQLTAAKDTFGAAVTDSTTVRVEKLVGYGLNIAHNACDLAGDTKLDGVFTVLEDIDAKLEQGKFTFLDAIISWFKAKRAAKNAQ